MANPQAQLQSLTDKYQSLQASLGDTIAARQKLASQQQENLSVQNTFKTLSDEDDEDSEKIYKLMGPVLLKQDRAEAVMAVDGRLTYINKEIERVESSIGEMRGQSEELKMQIYQLQSQLQGEQAQG